MFLFLSWKTFICNGWLWHFDSYICWGSKYVSHHGLVLGCSRLGHLRCNFQAAKTFSHSLLTADSPTLQSSHAQLWSVWDRQKTISNHLSDKWDFTGSERCSLCICSHARQLKTWKISLAAFANLVRFFEFTDSLINPHSAGDTLPTTAAFLAPEQSKIAVQHRTAVVLRSNQTLYEHGYHSCCRYPASVSSSLPVCPILGGSAALSGDSHTTETGEPSEASWKLDLSKPITHRARLLLKKKKKKIDERIQGPSTVYLSRYSAQTWEHSRDACG